MDKLKEVEIDFFGAEKVEIEKKKGREKFKTMQELHGYTVGRMCKMCRYIMCKEWGRNYYKCQIWKVSNSSATDIRLKDTACGKFEYDPEYKKRWKEDV